VTAKTPSAGPNKGDLKPGDIRWIKAPPGAKTGGAVQKRLSRFQTKDLARRLRKKLSKGRQTP
jgi:hypothetical protein